MKFDETTEQPCLNPSQGDIKNAACQALADSGSSGDSEPRLILKPGYASIPVYGQVQYSTFLLQNGVEQEITQGLVYSVSSQAIATIGVSTGSAAGASQGVVSVSVEWNGLSDTAQLNVVDTCDSQIASICVVVDASPSMSQLMTGYGTKLAYAKALAGRLANELNTAKDRMSILSFEADAHEMISPTAITADLLSSISSIATLDSGQGTRIVPALDLAASILQTDAALTKVIVIITDGVCNDGSDAESRAEALRSLGFIVFIVGVRSSGEGFELLQNMATGGFFLNAYDAFSGQDASDLASGLKGYLCAGRCQPNESYTVNQGELNYTGFANWDVIQNTVDLCGNGFFDLLPGNGLYVDMNGTTYTLPTLNLVWSATPGFVYPDPVTGVPPALTLSINFATKKTVRAMLLSTKWTAPIGNVTITGIKTVTVHGVTDLGAEVLLYTGSFPTNAGQSTYDTIGPNPVTIPINNSTAYLSYKFRVVDFNTWGPNQYGFINFVKLYETDSANDEIGAIRTKNAYTFALNENYRLTVSIAGNNRVSSTDDINLSISGMLDETESIVHSSGFTEFIYDFPGDGTSQKLTITQLTCPFANAGCLIGRVKLENLDTATILLDDDFDDENPTVITPPCPDGGIYNYSYTYCGGEGCLQFPPTSQSQDPNPPDKIE